jgi:hypothetical protein
MYSISISVCNSELECLKSIWGLGTEEEEGYRTGPPGYIGWRNSFLGIDSEAPHTFKNTGSDTVEKCRGWVRASFTTLKASVIISTVGT